ncbi:hypothetical protein ACWF9B_00135 [Streptomyces sp. NPDC055089]
MLENILLPCTWPESEGIAQIAMGVSRAWVYVRDLGEPELNGWLVLCLRGAPGTVQGPLAPVGEALAARTRTAVLRATAVHRAAVRRDETQVWRARARQLEGLTLLVGGGGISLAAGASQGRAR